MLRGRIVDLLPAGPRAAALRSTLTTCGTPAEALDVVERRRGYRRAMRRHGLGELIRILPGDYTEESGASAARALLPGPLPTAVFAANDNCAQGFLGTLLHAGLRVPENVSVVGYDDSPVARLSFINLTTVRQDAAALAQFVVQLASERLEGGRASRRDIVLEPTLIIRGTTDLPTSGANNSAPVSDFESAGL
jgi:DNA-binding LacI/PurR family transcriptional regulator